MTATIVVDASLLVKRVLAEPDSEAARAWFNANDEARFVAPALVFSEAGRILQKNLPNASVDALLVLHARLMGGIALVQPTETIWRSEQGLTFYDAHDVRLARELGATLATADDAMKAAAKKRGIALAKF